MTLCARLLMLLSIFFPKTSNLGIWNTILRKLGVTYDLGWWLVGKPMVETLFALNFFDIYYGYRFMRQTVQPSCFCWESTSLHSTFTWTGSSAINHSWRQKTRDTRLHGGKDHIACVPSFWHNTGVWRTDRFAIAYTALAKLALMHYKSYNLCEHQQSPRICNHLFPSSSARWRLQCGYVHKQ